jgi:hypothetical protein
MMAVSMESTAPDTAEERSQPKPKYPYTSLLPAAERIERSVEMRLGNPLAQPVSTTVSSPGKAGNRFAYP